MDFGRTPEQEALYAEVVKFAQTELNEDLESRDAACAFSRQNWKKCADFGLLRGNLPKRYGGLERDLETHLIELEGLGYGCRDAGLTLGINAQLWTIQAPILTYGSEAQCEAFLPALGRGELIGADAISEPGAGSDALSMQTTAVRQGDGYVLNGHKAWIGQAPVADLFLVFAKTNPAAGSWGISVFLVDGEAEGVVRSANRPKMGLRTLTAGDLELRDCFVPETRRLGPEGIGASFFNRSAEWERSFIQASNVGAMARQLEEGLRHARERRQFGQPIGDFQAVSHRLADMQVRLETARLFLYKAAWLMEKEAPAQLHAAMTKLVLSEAFLESSIDAVRLFGAKGYMSEFGIEKDLRDAMGGVIYAGTSDIQRNLIARLLGL